MNTGVACSLYTNVIYSVIESEQEQAVMKGGSKK